MTERVRAKTAGPRAATARPGLNGGWWKTLKLASGMFVVVLALMIWQMSIGRDPLLGAGSQIARTEPATVQRKLIVKRKVIIEQQPAIATQAPSAVAAPGSAYTGASGGSGGGTVVTQAPAAAPAPVYSSPAPAPAPAPVTRSS
ncbi:MAG: hypothetical protein HZB14_01190 [Actinobacteria bacterium]|nr:hypothetical protein [Actinomycetota bacterium]